MLVRTAQGGIFMDVATAAAVEAGLYRADPSHTSILFRIKHRGLSFYTGRFADKVIELRFDPLAPERMSVTASINLWSVRMDYAGTDKDWDTELAGSEQFFDARRAASATFQSTDVRRTGERTAIVSGTLDFRGYRRPIELSVTYNGSLVSPHDGAELVGFSATGQLRRSDFGLTFALGPMIPDDVQIIIEAELQRVP
jgi:polyisoprenoid-binding protein YceI